MFGPLGAFGSGAHYPDALGPEHRVNGDGELGITVVHPTRSYLACGVPFRCVTQQSGIHANMPRPGLGLPPGHFEPTSGKTESCRGEHPPDRGGRDPDAEPDEFALDARISPPRVLPSQLHDEADDLGVERWSTWTSPRVGPPPRHPTAVPRSRVAGRTMNADHRRRNSSLDAATTKTPSASVSFARDTCRRRTASSCRSATISRSFER